MIKRLQIVSIAAIAVILLSVLGCWILSATHKNNADSDVTYPPIENALDIYNAAVAPIKLSDCLSLDITKNVHSSIGSEVFEEKSHVSYAYEHLNTQQMHAYADESVVMGPHTFFTTEHFSNGKAYITVNGTRFVSDISHTDFSSRFAPAVCLDPESYAAVSGVDTGSYYMISFEKACRVESWVSITDDSFVSASGTACVSYQGELLNSIYELTYKNGTATVQLSYNITPTVSDGPIVLPDTSLQYVPVSYLDAPKLLEKATGYLLQAKNISSAYTDNIYFQAFGDRRVQNITVQTCANPDWSALVTIERTLTNTSREGEVSKTIETQLYADGIYQSSKDGSPLAADESIQLTDMQNYCSDWFLSTIMLPEYIERAYLTEGSSTLTIRFTGTQDFAKLISAKACQILYQKPNMLTDLAQSSDTDLLSGYVEIDKNTGLPVGSGITYKGTFIVNALPYELSFKADQTYRIPDTSTSDIIKKAAGA